MTEQKNIRVLVVDDEPAARAGLEKLLRGEGYAVDAADDGTSGLAAATEHPPDVVVTDLKMPKMDGIELVKKLHEHRSERAGDRRDGVRRRVERRSRDARGRPGLPHEADRLRCARRRDRARDRASRTCASRRRTSGGSCASATAKASAGSSARARAMQKVYRVARQVAASRATVLITGESGTGKGELARAIHSARPARRQTVRRAALRVARGVAPRERALRSRKGIVHGRRQATHRPLRASRWRNALPRRGRRDPDRSRK